VKVWVLTSEINAYDQFGAYFEAVYANKPTHQQLTEAKVPQNRLRHVLNGGGRIGVEDQWFILKEVDAL
jgi:hypothetical protein